MDMTLLPMIISACSVAISLASILYAMKSWHQTNRPIISARITTASGGNHGIALNILVENTGNRPAKNIRLIAERAAVLEAMSKPLSQEVPLDAQHCFFEHKLIPVLANGKAASNAFGATGLDGEWEPGTKIPLRIDYLSFGGKKYSEKMDLWLVDDAGFAQSFWVIPPAQ